MNFLVIVLLFVVFLQTRIMDLRRAIICLSVQSAVIALACFISGIAHGEGIHIYAPGLLTIIVKVLLVPYAMLRLVSKLTDERELISEINVNYSTAASAVFLVLSYLIVDKNAARSGRSRYSGAFHRNDFDWSDVDRYAQPSYYADGRLVTRKMVFTF